MLFTFEKKHLLQITQSTSYNYMILNKSTVAVTVVRQNVFKKSNYENMQHLGIMTLSF